MKIPAVALICLSVVLTCGGLLSAKPAKKGGQHPQQHQPPPAPSIGSRAPSVELGDFVAVNLDKILGPIDQQIALPRNQLMQLRESFTDRGTKASPNEKPAYEIAINVCAAISQAMDEREKAAASLQGSASVHGPSDLGAHRKDDPSRRDLRRERHEEKNRKQEAAQTDNFLTTQLKTGWTQKAMQLRQGINQLYARERDAERQAQQVAGAVGSAPSANTITLDNPVQVKVKYGTASIPAGTVLTVISRDSNGIVVDYAGEKVTLPP